MKKFFAFLLTFAMLFSLAMPAMAAEPTISGNTDNPTEGEVNATFDPKITITGITYSGETVTYDANSGNYVYLIPAGYSGTDEEYIPVTVTIDGKNLEYAAYEEEVLLELNSHMEDQTQSLTLKLSEAVAQGFTYYNGSLVLDPNSIADGLTVAFSFSNDNGSTWSDPVTLVYKQCYFITVSASENGTISCPEDAPEGNTVYLTVTPKVGYELETLSITGPDGDISSTKTEDGRYSFTMPAGDVTVSATFMESTTAPAVKTIYFDNTESWETVYAYAWDADSSAVLGGWPGTAMTKVEGEESIYTIDVSSEAVNIIFNNGSGGTGNQTGDLTIPTDDKNLYTYSTDEWSVYGSTVAPTVEALWGTDVDNLTGSGTLAEAIAAATAADSTVGYIQLQTNVTTDINYPIPSGVFSLDLNGKQLSCDGITVSKVGTEVTLTDTGTGGTVSGDGTNSVAIIVNFGAKVVINGGSYTAWTAIMAAADTEVEINGGSFTGTKNYAIHTYKNSVDAPDAYPTLTITNGTFSGVNTAVYTGGITTITGGTFEAGTDGHICYSDGTLDLSGYTGDPLTLSQWTDAELTVSDENIKLPEGYVFKDGDGNAVTTLAVETVYTIAPETTVPTYTITTFPTGSGTITAPDSAAAGDPVTVTFTPNEGYVLFEQYAYDPGNPDVDVILTQGADAYTFTFTMPARDVQVVGEFAKDGKAREDLYFNNNGNSAWSNVDACFLTDTGLIIDRVTLTMAENGIYTIPEDKEIPNLTYQIYFSNGSAFTATVEIPTREENMFTLGTTTNVYGDYEGTWSKYTPSQPPADVTSAEIVWGSMSFTYDDTIDETTNAEKGWSPDSAEGAATVTVKNTGETTFTAQATYTPYEGYESIIGSFDPASVELAPASGEQAGEEYIFTLELNGKPTKAIPAGTKIGKVTITINEAAEG